MNKSNKGKMHSIHSSVNFTRTVPQKIINNIG